MEQWCTMLLLLIASQAITGLNQGLLLPFDLMGSESGEGSEELYDDDGSGSDGSGSDGSGSDPVQYTISTAYTNLITTTSSHVEPSETESVITLPANLSIVYVAQTVSSYSDTIIGSGDSMLDPAMSRSSVSPYEGDTSIIYELAINNMEISSSVTYLQSSIIVLDSILITPSSIVILSTTDLSTIGYTAQVSSSTMSIQPSETIKRTTIIDAVSSEIKPVTVFQLSGTSYDAGSGDGMELSPFSYTTYSMSVDGTSHYSDSIGLTSLIGSSDSTELAPFVTTLESSVVFLSETTEEMSTFAMLITDGIIMTVEATPTVDSTVSAMLIDSTSTLGSSMLPDSTSFSTSTIVISDMKSPISTFGTSSSSPMASQIEANHSTTSLAELLSEMIITPTSATAIELAFMSTGPSLMESAQIELSSTSTTIAPSQEVTMVRFDSSTVSLTSTSYIVESARNVTISDIGLTDTPNFESTIPASTYSQVFATSDMRNVLISSSTTEKSSTTDIATRRKITTSMSASTTIAVLVTSDTSSAHSPSYHTVEPTMIPASITHAYSEVLVTSSPKTYTEKVAPKFSLTSSAMDKTSTLNVSSSISASQTSESGITAIQTPSFTSSTAMLAQPTVVPREYIVRMDIRLTELEHKLIENRTSFERTALEKAISEVYLSAINYTSEQAEIQVIVTNVGRRNEATSESYIDFYILMGGELVDPERVVSVIKAASPDRIAGYEFLDVYIPEEGSTTTNSSSSALIAGVTTAVLVVAIIIALLITALFVVLMQRQKQKRSYSVTDEAISSLLVGEETTLVNYSEIRSSPALQLNTHRQQPNRLRHVSQAANCMDAWQSDQLSSIDNVRPPQKCHDSREDSSDPEYSDEEHTELIHHSKIYHKRVNRNKLTTESRKSSKSSSAHQRMNLNRKRRYEMTDSDVRLQELVWVSRDDGVQLYNIQPLEAPQAPPVKPQLLRHHSKVNWEFASTVDTEGEFIWISAGSGIQMYNVQPLQPETTGDSLTLQDIPLQMEQFAPLLTHSHPVLPHYHRALAAKHQES